MDFERKNGVIQSSIALLQERFKQLQKEKEMRQRKELISNTMIIMSSSSSSSSSDSESESYNCTSHHTASAATNDRLRLLFADEVAVCQPPPQLSPPPPPQHHRLVALSLWPAGDVNDDNNASTIWKNLRGRKDEDNNKGLHSYGCLSHAFDDDDVDTSLRL